MTMKNHRMLMGLLVVAAVLAVGLPAGGDNMILGLEFNVNGQLPDVEFPDLFYDGQGPPVEANTFTVADGLLQQRSASQSSNWAPSYRTKPIGYHDNTQSLLIQVRARFFGGIGTGTEGGHVWLQDRYNTFGFGFGAGGIRLEGSAVGTLVPVTDTDFHIYQLESPANSSAVTLLMDGVPVVSGTAPSIGYGDIMLSIGDLASSNKGADVDWDYIRIFQPIPEPGTAMLLLAGSALMLSRRRRVA